MGKDNIYEHIKHVLADAICNQYTAELHLKKIKYTDIQNKATTKNCCEGVKLRSSFGTKSSRIRNLTQHLQNAGVGTAKFKKSTFK